MQDFKSDIIRVDQAEHQGYTVLKPGLEFQEKEYKYTEDTGTCFELDVSGKNLVVSSVCDGHAGYQTSFFVTSIMKKTFIEVIFETEGDVEKALSLLFVKLSNEVSQKRDMLANSGSTCNVTVFDSTNERVYVASLGDSPTLKYNRDDQNRYYLDWKTIDQDCSDPDEIERMVQIHRQYGDLDATKSSVVYEVQTGGIRTKVLRNKKTDMMIMSSFGDFRFNYYPGMINTTPRISSHVWRPSDVWIQCSDGILEWLSPQLRSIQPRVEFRVEEIARHLDICYSDENVAQSLHELQITSMFEAKMKAHPDKSDSTREWIETNFDNHYTKVFRMKD
jgi:serine/threonine protein phosphatase PrpC